MLLCTSARTPVSSIEATPRSGTALFQDRNQAVPVNMWRYTSVSCRESLYTSVRLCRSPCLCMANSQFLIDIYPELTPPLGNGPHSHFLSRIGSQARGLVVCWPKPLVLLLLPWLASFSFSSLVGLFLLLLSLPPYLLLTKGYFKMSTTFRKRHVKQNRNL